MISFAMALFWALIALMLIQLPFLIAFVSVVRKHLASVQQDTRNTDNTLSEKPLPYTAVILCLRGSDPFLSNCLRGLFSQNYPNYQVRIIIDSPEDPAWEIVAQTLEGLNQDHIKVSALEVKYETCSLKCSALIHAVSTLDDDCEAVAFIDSDTVPHPTWLRELIMPLEDRSIGLTVGNRWYIPFGNQWGTVVRYIWNISAVIQMNFFKIPWGGSLALRKERFQQMQLLERWKHSLCEDVLLNSVMQEQGLEIKFIPSLMMVNREVCELHTFIRWISRQLLLTRLYLPSWWVIFSCGLINSLAISLSVALLLFATAIGQWETQAWMAAGLVIYFLGLISFVGLLEREVSILLRFRGERIQRPSVAMVAKIFLAVPLAQFAFTVAIISAMQLQMVEWRGILYKVVSPWNIRLVQYRPYQDFKEAINTQNSL